MVCRLDSGKDCQGSGGALPRWEDAGKIRQLPAGDGRSRHPEGRGGAASALFLEKMACIVCEGPAGQEPDLSAGSRAHHGQDRGHSRSLLSTFMADLGGT